MIYSDNYKKRRALELSFFYGFHDVGRSTFGQQFFFHIIHVRGYVLEELMVSFAQVVQSRLTVGCAGEAVFRAFTVAGKEELTFLALARKGVLFHLPELHLAFAVSINDLIIALSLVFFQ